MTWFGWVFIVWLALGALLRVFLIGQVRKPLTHGAAVVYLLVSLAIVVGTLTVGTGSL